ncbi:hypothetical protein L1987_09839 [Smallanthus sonchifolius]|uniref:Uncharacterized protein n=1 Tax=Smallanthus sonchifolius TaxID=185202 RepID=A0ACB9JQF3_9ASTR|nr:hypothetical protein L1987_09839 [Smallanthus sonchifolius]
MDLTLTMAVVVEDCGEAREVIEMEKHQEPEVDTNGDIVREEEVSVMSGSLLNSCLLEINALFLAMINIHKWKISNNILRE